jgi:hypothetical protein
MPRKWTYAGSLVAVMAEEGAELPLGPGWAGTSPVGNCGVRPSLVDWVAEDRRPVPPALTAGKIPLGPGLRSSIGRCNIEGLTLGEARIWDEVVQLAELLGAPVYSESLSTNMNFPSRDYHWQWELPGDAPSMRQTLGEYDTVLFAGFSSHAPMTVYHGGPPLIPDSVTKIYLHYDQWEIAKNYPGAAAILGDVKTSLGPLNAFVERSRKRNRGDVAKRNEALRRTHEKLFKSWAAYIKQHRSRRHGCRRLKSSIRLTFRRTRRRSANGSPARH